MGTALALLGLGCWYMGPSKHAAMLTFDQIAQLNVTENSVIKNALGLCEKCQKPLRIVHGKFGDFIGCSGYPTCKYIKREKALFACPKCAGAVEKRVWTNGTLWGCSNYPECRYAIFSDIADTPCTKCNSSLYLLKTVDADGVVVLKCPNKECV